MSRARARVWTAAERAAFEARTVRVKAACKAAAQGRTA